ncbi:MAG: trigger factor [Peptostreptococcaceae bacterium]|nr:trigger factor [Peptostreptococcaceae bacterium]SFE34848.1 trigger factor [Peptostreptococcaceae bacterium pGA-8]
MKTNLISKENNEAKFTMEFTPEEFDAAVVKAYQATKGQFKINGFREGKAPRSIIEKHYGEGVFFEDAVNDLFQTGYPEAVKELELEVIDSPRAEFSDIGKGKSMVVTITVPVYPIVEVSDYFGVEVEKLIPTLGETAVEDDIKALQKRNARMVVADRPAKEGDTLVFDYAGFVGEEQFEGGTAENQQLKLGSGMFIPGFEEQLIGVAPGEKKDVNVTFPEDYHAELAGKDAVFHCLVHEIKEEQLPELDDEFAKDVSEFDTLEELKKDTADRLLKNAEENTVNMAKDAVIEKVYAANKVEIPAVMIEDEIDRMTQEIAQQLSYQGLTVEQYLQFMDKTMADFRNELREDAEKKVGTRLVLMSIVEKEGVTVTEEEMEEEIKKLAEVYKTEADKIKEMIGVENITFFQKDLQLRKVIDLLYDKAVVTEKAPEEKAETEEKGE